VRVPDGRGQLTFALFLGFGLQGLSFLLLARELGPAGFGAFASLTAIFSSLQALALSGGADLVVRDGSVDARRLGEAVGRGLLMSSVGSAVALVTGMVVAKLVLGEAVVLTVIASIGVAETISLRFSQFVSRAYQARSLLRTTALLILLPGLTKLVATVGVVFGPGQGLAGWASGYLLVSSVGAALATVLLLRLTSVVWIAPGAQDWRDGLHFSVAGASQTIYAEADKVILPRYRPLEDVGSYAAAYRIIDAAMVPIRARAMATLPHYYRASRSELRLLVRGDARLAVLYGVTVGLALVGVAYLPVIPAILGSDFASSRPIVAAMAVLPLLRGVGLAQANALTAEGQQAYRARCHGITALTNVVGNLLLIPTFGVVAAVATTLASEALFAALCWWRRALPSHDGGRANV
jgi:O-antigen/teichoic acid export membrane protein